MRKITLNFSKRLLIISAITVMALAALLTACVPGATGAPTATGASLFPYIQSISAAVVTAGAAASPSAAPSATAVPSATSAATPTASSTAMPSMSAMPSATAAPGASSAATSAPPATATPAAGGKDVQVAVQVVNFNVVNKLSQPAVPGEGHLHFFLDVVPPIEQGVPAVTGPGTYVAVAATTYTWPGVKPGLHVLSAELANNDHTPLSSPVVASTMIWVPDATMAAMPQITSFSTQILAAGAAPAATSAATPSAAPSMTAAPSATTMPSMSAMPSATAAPPATATSAASPSATSAAKPGAVNIMVSIEPANFNVVNKQGQAAAAGEGHIHYFLDSIPPTFPFQVSVPTAGSWVHVETTSYTWMNVLPGFHLLVAELVNNDHTSLNPPVVVASTIMVMPAGAPPSASATVAPSATSASVTPSVTASPTAAPTPSPSATASPTASASPSATAAQSATASPTASGAPSGPIDLVAQNIAFDKKTITVKAGSMVTINFNNKDSGIPHNFAAYTDSSASTPIFVGAIITGPATTTYTFSAPSTPGTYFFRCDVHPTQMTGQFIVQ